MLSSVVEEVLGALQVPALENALQECTLWYVQSPTVGVRSNVDFDLFVRN
jgi:hypothetical protein